ncbi:ABC transporter substrate-binding protein [Paenibacillus beijingensis]|uniref:Solute-binding protein family 5 domain-containing protein n=1 Tax=Paenibacillus beijingensis TaxID=1126833 RepID=A0A0D5NJI5_9BACL|nr:ABC transporter substrate-binding protein [Paenibacillus beijingensis]AJY75098.1 hypothetical protein VN24_11570 [Paenibacillus beijingensis]
MDSKKMKAALSLLLLVTMILAGCSGKETGGQGAATQAEGSAQEAPAAQDLKIALNAQPTTLDTQMTTAWVTTHVSRNIYETLMVADEHYQIKPMLAESYVVSADAKTFTFKLRKGVLFHNGKEMKADDVAASMNRWMKLTTVGKATFGDSKFTKVDDYTVEMKLDKPSGVALQVMTNTNQFAAIMPKEVADTATDSGVKEYIGTGPYKFDEWKQDQFIHLTKFDGYKPLDGEPSGLAGHKEALTTDLYFDFVTDSSTRLAGLQSGQYDVAMELPPDNLAQLKADPDIKTYTSFTGYNPLILNNKKGIFSNVKARQAVAAALDMDAIMKGAYGDPEFYRIDGGIMMKEQSNWYSEAGLENYNQKNKEKAIQLLKEASYNGEPVRLITSRDYEDLYNTCVVIKAQLEEIGMNVDLQTYDWGTVLSKQPNPDAWDFFPTTFSSKTDPTQILYLDSRNGWAGWTNNPIIDKLLDQIRSSSSQEQSKKWFDEVQKEFWTSVPVIKLGDKYALMASGSKVEGFRYFEGPVFWNVKKTA